MIEAPKLTPFFGFVENNNDEIIKANRYQVRVVGYNSSNEGELPSSALKWFPALNGMEASLGGIGRTTRFLKGTMVFGFYLDNNLQEGIIMGSLLGANDVSSIAKGEGGIPLQLMQSNPVSGVPDGRGGTFSQPFPDGETSYSKNDVNITESGHMIMVDDTPGSERIVIMHKSGTYEEIRANGEHTIRNVEDGYEINLRDKYLFINGDFSHFVKGDYHLNVGGEMYCKVGGDVIFDTKKVLTLGNSEATDHISSNVSGRDHIHGGVQNGSGTTSNPLGANAGFAPTPANTFSLETEDTGLTASVISSGLSQGFITPEDVQVAETYVPEVVEKDETPIPETPAQVVDCSTAVDDKGKVDYSALLAPGITLRSVSLGAVVSQYAIQDQNGLTKSDIVCNLKNLVENVLVPLKAQYPGAMVTSGFRAGTGKSQHMRGEAIDIQFRGASKTDYYNIAVWIKNNLPYDQLILEYKNFGTGLPWIHVSLKRSKSQRRQIFTYFNHKKAADGLRNMA